MLKTTGIGLVSCLFMAVLPVSAQDTKSAEDTKFYNVEIIVFKNINVPKAHEFKLPTPSASRTENTLDLSDPKSLKKARASGFVPLTPKELSLQGSVDRIVKSSRYNLLIHTGWRQPGLDETQSIPVWIKGGKVFDSRYSSIDQAVSADTRKNDSTQISPNQPTTLDGLYELEGLVTITLSRYLHTRAELVLRKPADAASLIQQADEFADTEQLEMMNLEGQLLLNYGLNEQRRMRSRKLHYLDHPEFGMLVLITPYEAPVAEEPVVSENAETNTVKSSNPVN